MVVSMTDSVGEDSLHKTINITGKTKPQPINGELTNSKMSTALMSLSMSSTPLKNGAEQSANGMDQELEDKEPDESGCVEGDASDADETCSLRLRLSDDEDELDETSSKQTTDEQETTDANKTETMETSTPSDDKSDEKKECMSTIQIDLKHDSVVKKTTCNIIDDIDAILNSDKPAFEEDSYKLTSEEITENKKSDQNNEKVIDDMKIVNVTSLVSESKDGQLDSETETPKEDQNSSTDKEDNEINETMVIDLEQLNSSNGGNCEEETISLRVSNDKIDLKHVDEESKEENKISTSFKNDKPNKSKNVVKSNEENNTKIDNKLETSPKPTIENMDTNKIVPEERSTNKTTKLTIGDNTTLETNESVPSDCETINNRKNTDAKTEDHRKDQSNRIELEKNCNTADSILTLIETDQCKSELKTEISNKSKTNKAKSSETINDIEKSTATSHNDRTDIPTLKEEVNMEIDNSNPVNDEQSPSSLRTESADAVIKRGSDSEIWREAKRLRPDIPGKRPSSDTEDGIVEKKVKISDDIELKEDTSSNQTKIKKDISDTLILKMLPLLFENEPIPAVNIEEIIMAKIIEAISQRTELSSLRQQTLAQEQSIEQYRKKFSHLNKQIEDINTVLHRLSLELQNRDRHVMPVRITRSVGLQVTMPVLNNRLSTGMYGGRKKGPTTTSQQTSASTPPPTQTTSASTTTTPTVPSPNITQRINKPTTNTSSATSSKKLQNIAPKPSPAPLLSKALSQKTDTKSATVDSPKVSSPHLQANKEKPAATSATVKSVIDLTDEDIDVNKTTQTTAAPQGSHLVPLAANNIRVVPVTNGVQQPRVTYLMTPQVPGQNSRQVLIATPAVARPGGAPGAIRPQRLVIQNGFLPNMGSAVVQRPGLILTNGTAPTNGARVPVRMNTPGVRNGNPPKNITATQLIATVNAGAPIQSTEPATLKPTTNGHPAPLPIMLNQPHLPGWKQIPPRPALKICRAKDGGIQLSWSLPELDNKTHEVIASYQLYAYQETNVPPCTELWRKVGDIKALPLPMACTLTSFSPGNKYYFAVRAIDSKSRVSQFSYAQPIILKS